MAPPYSDPITYATHSNVKYITYKTVSEEIYTSIFGNIAAGYSGTATRTILCYILYYIEIPLI
jgi:hypothetical protein